MTQPSRVTRISLIPTRGSVTSPEGEATSSVRVSPEETSVTRPRYASPVTDVEHHIEQINIIPAAISYAASTTVDDRIHREDDEPLLTGRLPLSLIHI